MAKTRQSMTLTIPVALMNELQRISREENRSSSEIVGEALRCYVTERFPAVKPTKQELAGVSAGQAQIKKGDFVTLEQLLHYVDAPDRKAGRKGATKASRS